MTAGSTIEVYMTAGATSNVPYVVYASTSLAIAGTTADTVHHVAHNCLQSSRRRALCGSQLVEQLTIGGRAAHNCW